MNEILLNFESVGPDPQTSSFLCDSSSAEPFNCEGFLQLTLHEIIKAVLGES